MEATRHDHDYRPKRKSTHSTQWAAQFAVASELCKRGYEVALTLGNHPTTDLMVVSPAEKWFAVDVKGLARPNFWQVREKRDRDDVFYVFALVPAQGRNRFFIMSQTDVNLKVREISSRAETAAESRGKKAWTETRPGLNWGSTADAEDCWDRLPK